MPQTELQTALKLLEGGRIDDAAPRLARILASDPDQPQALRAMMYVHTLRGRFDEAEACGERALRRSPTDTNLLYRLGQVRHIAGQLEAAAGWYTRTLAADPTQADAHAGLTDVLFRAGRYTEAIARADAGLLLNPGEPRLIQNKTAAMVQLGRAREAMPILQRACAAHPRSAPLALALATCMNYVGGVDHASSLEAHKRHAALLAPAPGTTLALPPPPKPRDPERPLKIGILSGDLRRHSVGRFIEPFFSLGEGFETFAYSTTPVEDEFSAHLRSLGGGEARWRRIGALAPADLARQIRRDAIDILVETSGLTQDHRLAALRLRPAPIQVSAVGYPATTAIPEIDYRLVDSLTDPRGGGSESLITERPLRLDPCFLCFVPPAEAPPAQSAIRNPQSAMVFGSFNALAKLDDATLRLWTDLLRAVPNSRLVIKALALRDPASRADLARRFTAAAAAGGGGIDPARLDLREPPPGLTEHLAAYRDIDLALDTFPYHGTTTTCEALHMGVPVLALAGRAHASRVGVSLLTAIGLPELIARAPDDFVSAAAALAGDRARLAALRAGLRERLLTSTLCDRAAYISRLASALRTIWRDTCHAPTA